ncbi:S-adenosyl-L-methionine-dependent methyltransferase [Biscogniauxia mediterranea]|nr:S-adenosyl-L-methionine-dependent methyltransferase [Biscogniauxia mediterranea]
MTSSDSAAADLNRAYFDEQAATYDARHAKLIDRLTREIQNRLDFIGVDWADDDDDDDEDEDVDGSESEEDEEEDEEKKKDEKKPKREVRLLDYACGTGLVSRALAPYVTQCVGVDISANMVAAYNARAQNQGLSRHEMHAVQGDLLSPIPSLPLDDDDDDDEGGCFHIAAVGMGFHHFADPGLAARRLAARLRRPGGVLLVVDFLAASDDGEHEHEHEHPRGHGHGHGNGKGHGHGHGNGGAHTVMHGGGFTEAQVRDMFEGAGAGGDFRLEVVGRGFVGGSGGGWGKEEEGEEEEEDGKKRVLFMARGTVV